jgi:hypothetical protein
VTGLVEQTKNSYYFAGEYNMPFTVTIMRAGTPASCTAGLP